MASTMKIVSFALLALVTFLAASHIPRHQPSGEQLLRNPTFTNNLEDWQYSAASRPHIGAEADGTVTLRAADATQQIALVQTIDGLRHDEPLLLSGELQCDKVVVGAKPWYLARLVLARYDAQGRWLSLPHYVAALSGSHGWQTHATVFLPDARTARIEVRLELPHASGTLRARNLSLRRAEVNPLYAPLQWAVFFAWGGFLAWWLLPYLRRARRTLPRLAILLVMALLLGGILLPGGGKVLLQEGLQRATVVLEQKFAAPVPVVAQRQPPAPQKTGAPSARPVPQPVVAPFALPVDPGKAAHVALFALLTLVLVVAAKQARHAALLLDLAMLAVATELLQLFVLGRTALLGDVLLDLGGVLAGLLVVAVWGRVTGKGVTA